MSITIVGGGNPSGPTFPVQRSVRLRASASAYFNRTVSVAGNRQIFTWSGWVKKSQTNTIENLLGTPYNTASLNSTLLRIGNDTIQFATWDGGVQTGLVTSANLLRDPSAWYHIVISVNTTQATAANRIRIYVNGVEVAYSSPSYPAQNYNAYINSATTHYSGVLWFSTGGAFSAAQAMDGYLTEVNFIDGQALTPTSFGAYNSYGVWSPAKYTGTYGTNGFYLNFQDNSAATAAAIGKDSSGNGNNWTPNNISVTAGVTYDSMLDVPTLTNANNANFATLNPLFGSSGTLGNANLSLTASAANPQRVGTIAVSSGKWYYEVTLTSLPAGSDPIAGFTDINNTSAVSQYVGQASSSYAIYTISTNSFLSKVNNATFTNTNTSVAAQGNILSVALDLDNNKIWFAKNGTWVDSGDPAAGTNSQFTVTAGTYVPAFRGSGGGVSCTIDANFGQRPFTYTPPSGFKSLNTYNLPAPTIPNGAAYMAATLYTGTGAAQSITNTVNGVSMQPDFVWIKSRNNIGSHQLIDSVRGIPLFMFSDATNGDTSRPNSFTSFNSNGFTVGSSSDGNTNLSTYTYVGWQWKANGTPAVVNTSGSIPSTISVNTTAGFSIVTYTGTGANATVGHGLGIAPKMVIVKQRNSANSWIVYQSSLGATKYLRLETTDASATATAVWNDTAPTSSVFTVGTSGTTNGSTATYVAYCWAEIPGFSKFGSYTGNGSADGPFVYLGFRPRYILIKRTDIAGASWNIRDTSRNTFNTATAGLFANLSNAESTQAAIDILSNGFKCRDAGGSETNASGGTYIYACFAENPFNYSLAR